MEVGDKVRIKSIDWFNSNSNNFDGYITFDTTGVIFVRDMSKFCNMDAIITSKGKVADNAYHNPHIYKISLLDGIMTETPYTWTDEMFLSIKDMRRYKLIGLCEVE